MTREKQALQIIKDSTFGSMTLIAVTREMKIDKSYVCQVLGNLVEDGKLKKEKINGLAVYRIKK